MAASSVVYHMNQLDALTEKRRRHKLLLFPVKERRSKLLSEYRGTQAFRQLATPMDGYVHVPSPNAAGQD
jgi:hypothetical protein